MFRGSDLGRNSGVRCTRSADLHHTLEASSDCADVSLSTHCLLQLEYFSTNILFNKVQFGPFPHLVLTEKFPNESVVGGDGASISSLEEVLSLFPEPKTHQQKGSFNPFCILPPGGACANVIPAPPRWAAAPPPNRCNLGKCHAFSIQFTGAFHIDQTSFSFFFPSG